jgi:hypothetical protein
MSIRKKINLPPKPTIRPKGGPPKAAPEVQKSPADLSGLKATSFKVTLSDGTYLEATGDQAENVWRYLEACERYCASHAVVTNMGFSLTRYDASGNVMATGNPTNATVRS